MSYRLGIDLGTTFTAAAVNREGRIEMATLGRRGDAIPSVVLVRADDSTLVGEPAEYRGATEPERLAREFKRRMGDTTPILLAGSPHSAESLTGRLLRWVVDEVTRREGGEPDSVTVTHPANWGPYKIELLEQATQLAGLGDVCLLTEPEAAAAHYVSQERVEVDAVIAVYDLGGGTFDAAVLRKTRVAFDVMGRPRGVERLGGIDFDAAVFGHVARALDGAIDRLDGADPASVGAVARLRADCVTAKETLSADTDVSIPVALPGVNTEIRLTRAEFEEMIRPALAESVGALRLAIESAGVDPNDVDAVLLVGGSSQIPLVAQMVGADLDRPVNVDAHPKNSIARGASMFEPEPEIASASVEPGPSLRPPGPGPAPGSPARPNRHRSWAWLKVAIPAAVLAAAVVGIVAVAAGGNGDESATDVLPTVDDATTTTSPSTTTASTTSTTAPTTTAPVQLDDRALLDQGPLTVVGRREISELVANPQGEAFSVKLDGESTISLTLESGGGRAAGTITGEMSGNSIELNTPHSASFTGELIGSYDADSRKLEGTIDWTGSTTDGVEAALPSDTEWSGTLFANTCPGDDPAPCIFARTEPESDLIWVILLDPAVLNPNRRVVG